MPRAVVVSAALGLAVVEAAVPAVQAPPGLVRLAQSLLGTGVPVALVVERQDPTRTAGGELHNTDPGGALELLQSEGGAWEVSREPVILEPSGRVPLTVSGGRGVWLHGEREV